MSNPLAPRPPERLHRNIEIKATVAEPGPLRAAASRIATEHLGYQTQVDTYFHCQAGRLKLREIAGQPAQLIWYERPDQTASKASSYFLIPVADAEVLRAALSAGLGVRKIVRKRREILLHHYIRIHLDQVDGLGNFLELEAVLDHGATEEEARRLVDQLLVQLGVHESQLLPGSYAEMLEEPC